MACHTRLQGCMASRIHNWGGGGGAHKSGNGRDASNWAITVASICHDLMSSEAFVCPQLNARKQYFLARKQYFFARKQYFFARKQYSLQENNILCVKTIFLCAQTNIVFAQTIFVCRKTTLFAWKQYFFARKQYLFARKQSLFERKHYNRHINDGCVPQTRLASFRKSIHSMQFSLNHGPVHV